MPTSLRIKLRDTLHGKERLIIFRNSGLYFPAFLSIFAEHYASSRPTNTPLGVAVDCFQHHGAAIGTCRCGYCRPHRRCPVYQCHSRGHDDIQRALLGVRLPAHGHRGHDIASLRPQGARRGGAHSLAHALHRLRHRAAVRAPATPRHQSGAVGHAARRLHARPLPALLQYLYMGGSRRC